MCAPLLVLYLIKQPERLGGIITDGSGGLTCNRTALSHPTLFSKYVHKCTGEGPVSPEETALALATTPADHKSTVGQAA